MLKNINGNKPISGNGLNVMEFLGLLYMYTIQLKKQARPNKNDKPINGNMMLTL